MQTIPNPRASRFERFPTRMSVEIGEGDAREAFEADVLDFTRAGASMRASRSPEIGTQLECGFRCGAQGTMVRARAEVVWAEVEGESHGEFGLAFTGLDPDAREIIDGLFAQPIARRESAEADVARLELEGSTEPISARVARREPRSAVFEQQLELLSLGRGVRTQAPGAEDCRGSIAGVGLRMVGDVPTLAVTVRFDESAKSERDLAVDDNIDPNVPHDTVADMASPYFAMLSVADPGAGATTLSDGRLAPPETSDDLLNESIAVSAAEGDAAAETFDSPPADESVREEGQASLWAALSPRVEAVRDAATRSLEAARELVTQWRSDMSSVFEERFGEAGGRLRDAYHAQVGSRVGAVRRLVGTRRRTASAREKSADTSSRRFLIGAGIGTAALVGVMVYALNGSSPEPAPTDTGAATETAVLPAVGMPEASDAPAAHAPAEVSQGQRPAPTVAGSTRRKATLAAGDDVPPGAVAEGVPAAAPALTSLAAAPSAEDAKAARPSARAGKPHFGADELPRAGRFSIRMAAPIASLEGVAHGDGFTVTVSGAQALDRAAPLVKRFPGLLSSAKIRNRAGHAELELKFAAGKRPQYQVVADGSWLRIALREK